MLKLFKIQVNRKADPLYFDSKRVARYRRERLREELGVEDIPIMRGPDHWRGESYNGANA